MDLQIQVDFFYGTIIGGQLLITLGNPFAKFEIIQNCFGSNSTFPGVFAEICGLKNWPAHFSRRPVRPSCSRQQQNRPSRFCSVCSPPWCVFVCFIAPLVVLTSCLFRSVLWYLFSVFGYQFACVHLCGSLWCFERFVLGGVRTMAEIKRKLDQAPIHRPSRRLAWSFKIFSKYSWNGSIKTPEATRGIAFNILIHNQRWHPRLAS